MKFFHRNIAYISILTALILSGCSTKKNTVTSRAYHNLTAYYNVHWNGKERLKDGLKTMDVSYIENYSEVLPIYKYCDRKKLSSISPQMDYVVDKSKKTIRKHSMVFYGKEKVRWIDDSFLLQGKALFYKQDYIKARRIFEYVINTYPAPEKVEAMIWLGRTYTQMENYGQAISLFDQVNKIIKTGNESVNRFTKQSLPLMYAEVELYQHHYLAAIPYIQQGIAINNNKTLNTRLKYILAQIYQRNNNDSEAHKYYQEVIKRKPPYEMLFNAHIELATSLDANAQETEKVIKKLNKMLVDVKNEDYVDKIYYALGEIQLKRNQDSSAINYLRKSVQYSTINEHQKAQSSLKVAEIYFDKKEFPLSKYYYDTALMVLPIDFPNLMYIQRKSYTLSQLIENLDNIQLQDSLQSLAKMTDAERNSVIDLIIKTYVEEQQRIEKENQQRYNEYEDDLMVGGRIMDDNSGKQRNSFSGVSTGNTAGGDWYFYNIQAKNSGFNEFIKKWGRRKLEDNWRLSNKKADEFSFDTFNANKDDAGDGAEAENDSIAKLANDPRSRESYLQYIPLTEEMMRESDSIVYSALYNNGFIYKIQLQEDLLSIKSFEDFVTRYPENEKIVSVYYQLYRLYEKLGMTDKQDEAKSIIIKQFPDTDFALILQNPDYYKNIFDITKTHQLLYQDSYNAFMEGDYYTSKIISDDAINNYPVTKMTPRFKLLRAISVRRISDNVDSLKVELLSLVKDFPKSDVFPLAQDILKRIKMSEDSLSLNNEDFVQGKNLEKALEIYKEPTPTTAHYYSLLLNANNVNIEAIKTRISDHNRKHFKNIKLNISTVIFQDSIHMITVTSFSNMTEGMTYMNLISQNEYVFSTIDSKDFKQFLFSTNNYSNFYLRKDFVEYQLFFEKFYPVASQQIHLGSLKFLSKE